MVQGKLDHPRILSKHRCFKHCDCERVLNEVKNWKGIIMQDENGEIVIKEERDMTGLTLTQIDTESYLKSFSEFINSENPKELLRTLFCDVPEKMFLELTPDEQLDFVHKLDQCVKVIKIYSQSAEVNRRNKVETLELEEQVRINKKDKAYKVRPIEKNLERTNTETKQEKFVNMLRSMKNPDGTRTYTEEQILAMIHGEKKK
jgi:hypothetical protein